MKIGISVCAAMAALGTLSIAPSAQSSVAAGSASAIAPVLGGKFTREPTLVYDLTGSSFAGPVHTSVVVYNDGLVSYASRTTFGGSNGDAFVVSIDPNEVAQLTADLDAAGADELPDSFAIFPDLPITTVTFMKPAADTKAHPFTFAVGGAGHTAVSTLINEFVQEHLFGVTPSAGLSAPDPAFGGPFKQEPLLVYDVTGSTFIGPFHLSLTVFNNGHVSYSTASTLNEGEAFERMVPVKDVELLGRSLASLGVNGLTDSVGSGADIPITTVTFMRPKTDTKAHTFSYLAGGPGHNAVGAAINTFIQDVVLAP